MSTAVDIDVAALVGEMEAPACESLGHGHNPESDVHDGEATHYVRVQCPACDWNTVKAYCGPFVAYIVHVGRIRCARCAACYNTQGLWTILGPVGA
jgi:hypothetical protein